MDLTDGGGNVTAGYGYDVFGAIRAQTGGSPNEFQFTGEQRDSDSSLYYLRARYYDPATGRFIGPDPLPFLNRYAYVGNNPVNYLDPYGLFGFKDLKKVGKSVVKTVKNSVDATADAFGPPYDTTKLLQIADVIPLTPICGWTGRVAGGAIGGAVAGPAGATVGAIGGAAAGTIGCAWLEKKIGQAAAVATYWQILNSNCSNSAKAMAAATNSVNLAADIGGKPKIFGGLSVGKVFAEAGMYVASSQMLDCGTPSGPGTVFAAEADDKE